MHKDLGDNRKSYKKSALTEDSVPDNPIQLFQSWFYENEALENIDESNAMNLSTIGIDGFPKARMVLLKKYTEEGFIFYTNYDSEKGRAIAQNPNVCLSFFWSVSERQVIIKGRAEKIAENLSDGYFESRPLGSKLGAIVSDQSEVIPSRDVLEEKLAILAKQMEGKEIERPKNWGGFIVKPKSLEFWQGRPNRLHDRIRYSLQKNLEWKIERLAP